MSERSQQVHGTQVITGDGLFKLEIGCNNLSGLVVHVSLRALMFLFIGTSAVEGGGGKGEKHYVGYSLTTKASVLCTLPNQFSADTVFIKCTH
jgi:hypothetical protein